MVGSYVDAATAEGFAADWELERHWEALRQVYGVGARKAEELGEQVLDVIRSGA